MPNTKRSTKINVCVHMFAENECEYFQKSINSRGECLWQTYGILDEPICCNPYHDIMEQDDVSDPM